MRNPFAVLPHQPSPNRGYAVLLDRDFDTLYRNRFSGRKRNGLRRKERRLSQLGKLQIGWAKNLQERHDLLDTFFRQKAEWFAKHGIADPFTAARRRFFEKLSALPDGTAGRLEAGYLKIGDAVAATFHGSPVGNCHHMLLSSIASGETERWSPGILLMREEIRYACGKDFLRYDLGIGQARHKSEWCDEEIDLFDSYIALDETGYALTLPMAALSRAKRAIKNSPLLWSLVQTLRRARARLSVGKIATS
jgi:CelD/BcsL family acetyltransferase involved in cellulose biosynthesis